MSNAWNLDIIRRLAGLPQQPAKQLNEDFGDDDSGDDEDPDVKIANSDKRQAAFEKKNKKTLSSADKEASELKKKPAAAKPEAKKEDKKKPAGDKFVHGKGFVKADEEGKKEEPKAAPAKAEPEAKKDVSAEEKKRGRAPSDDSKSGQARAWLTHDDNKGHKRGDFIKHATSKFGMSAHHANTFYYAHKKKSAATGEPMKEAWVLYHQHLPGFMLAENREMNQMQWIDPSSPLEPFIFETEAEAERIAKYMAEWKNQTAVVTKVSFED